MMLWAAVISACALCFAIKLFGHKIPQSWLQNRRMLRISAFVPVALLAALLAVQTADAGGRLAIDARLPALAVAAILLWRKAPFIVAVMAAAAVAALWRLFIG